MVYHHESQLLPNLLQTPGTFFEQSPVLDVKVSSLSMYLSSLKNFQFSPGYKTKASVWLT